MEINAPEKSEGIAILFRAFRKKYLFSVQHLGEERYSHFKVNWVYMAKHQALQGW